MSTAISVALYPIVWALFFALPAWAISRLLHRWIKPGPVKDFLYKQRELYPGANVLRRRQELEAVLRQPKSPQAALEAYRELQRL